MSTKSTKSTKPTKYGGSAITTNGNEITLPNIPKYDIQNTTLLNTSDNRAHLYKYNWFINIFDGKYHVGFSHLSKTPPPAGLTHEMTTISSTTAFANLINKYGAKIYKEADSTTPDKCCPRYSAIGGGTGSEGSNKVVLGLWFQATNDEYTAATIYLLRTTNLSSDSPIYKVNITESSHIYCYVTWERIF